MGFADSSGSDRGDEDGSGLGGSGGFGGWGGSDNEHGASKGDERGDSDFGGTGSESRSDNSQDRQTTDVAAVEDTRSYLSRIRDIFSTEDEPDQLTDSQGNIVGEAYTIDRPAEIQTVDLGEKTAYETIDSPNPYESYARSVVDDGLVGDEQKEKDLAQDIAQAGRTAQAADVASTFGTAIAGPFGAVPGLVHDVATAIQDDPVQQAGQSLYEGGKINAPGASTAIGTAFGGIASTAFDAANEVFGGSSQLGAFEEAAGVSGFDSNQTNRPSGNTEQGSDSFNVAQSITPEPVATTMADTFSMSNVGGNIYSDFLDNFFKQG